MLQHIISACRTRQQHWLGFSFAKSNIFPFDGKFLLRRPPVHCSGSQGITNAIPLHVYEQNTMRSTHQGRAMSKHLAAYLLERAALSEHIRQDAEAHTGALMSVLAEVPDPEAPAAAHLDRGQSPQLSGAPTPTPAQARQSQRGGAIDSDLSSKRHLQTTLKS